MSDFPLFGSDGIESDYGMYEAGVHSTYIDNHPARRLSLACVKTVMSYYSVRRDFTQRICLHVVSSFYFRSRYLPKELQGSIHIHITHLTSIDYSHQNI